MPFSLIGDAAKRPPTPAPASVAEDAAAATDATSVADMITTRNPRRLRPLPVANNASHPLPYHHDHYQVWSFVATSNGLFIAVYITLIC